MGCAEVISFAEVRARKQGITLRQRLHERCDQWRDTREERLSPLPSTLPEVTDGIWKLRQRLTGSMTEALLDHTHQQAGSQHQASCPKCHSSLKARRSVRRQVETLVGPVELCRPYFYCRACRYGFYPLDAALALAPGRKQVDIQQAAATLAVEVPYETAHMLFRERTGVALGAERLHTLTNTRAEGLQVWEVSPTRQEVEEQRVALRAGTRCRPILVMAMDGAHVPTRPNEAAGHRDGSKRHHARRARWRGQYREAKGVRLYLLDGERIMHVLSWHQVQDDQALAESLRQIKEAGLIPQEQVRLCVVGDGAPWIWKHVQQLFPTAQQVLDYYHCAERIHEVAVAQYGQSLQAVEWTEATLTRLSQGLVRHVIGGLKRMRAASDEVAHALSKLIDYLDEHRHRTAYQRLRRGGYPLGSGGIESSNKFICHVRLKRSGAWWYVANSNHILALRCAKYNGTFGRVFERYRERLVKMYE
jgi:hypothetical protein